MTETMTVGHQIDEYNIYSLSVTAQTRSKFELKFDHTPTQIVTCDLQMGQLLRVFAELQPSDSVWRRCFRALRRFRLARVSLEPSRYDSKLNRTDKTLIDKSVQPEKAELLTLHRDTNVQFNDLQLGDVVVLYGYRQLTALDGSGVTTPTFSLIGVVPWFFDAQFYQAQREIRWEHLIVNTTVDRLPKHIGEALKRIEQPTAFLPLTSVGEAAAASVDVTEEHQRQLISFALRWHQKRHAAPPPTVKQKEEIERWRDNELRNLFESRSFVFFAHESPRLAIFNRSFGWDVIIDTLRSFRDMGSAAMLVDQVCDVLRFVLRTELEWRGELVAFNFMNNFLRALANGIVNVHVAQLEQEAKKADQVESILNGALATTTARTSDFDLAQVDCKAYMNTVRDALRKATLEPIDVQIRTGQQLLDSKTLSLEKLYYIASPVAAPRNDDEDEDALQFDEPSNDMKRFVVKDAVVLSYNFCGGVELIADALREVSMGTYKNTENTTLRGGVVYVGRLCALTCCVSLLRKFLLQHFLSQQRTPKKQTELEKTFRAALPQHNNIYYAEEGRSSDFDDIAVGSVEHRVLVAPSLDRQLFNDFLHRRNGVVSLPLPANFNAPRFLGLTRSLDELLKMRKISHSVQTRANGPVMIDDLALVTIAHKSECHRPSSSSRAHLTIEYDKEKRDETKNSILKQVDTLVGRAALDNFDDLVGTKKCCTGASENSFPNIEDLVRNLYDNRAMPLCMRQYAEQVVERQAHLKYQDRIIMYRMLHSLNLPELKHQHIMRFLMQYSPRNKISDHFKESLTYDDMAVKRHKNAIAGYIKAKRENGHSNVTEEDARAATTSAQSCYTMQRTNDKRHCPFVTHSQPTLRDLIRRSGVDDPDTIDEIIRIANVKDRNNEPTIASACLHQMHMSRPVETRSTPFYSAETQTAYPPRHPYQMVYLAADHRLRHLERNNDSKPPPPPPPPPTTLPARFIDYEDSSTMYIETEEELKHMQSSNE